MNQPSICEQQIIELRSHGLTLEAIGQQFGLTKERVRQIISHYGIAKRGMTQADLMARFGVEWYEINQAMKAAGLTHRPGQRQRYALTDADVVKIAKHLHRRRLGHASGVASPLKRMASGRDGTVRPSASASIEGNGTGRANKGCGRRPSRFMICWSRSRQAGCGQGSQRPCD